MSSQIDSRVAERYERGKWLVLRGIVGGSNISSTYSFARDVIGYDLAAFFQRNNQQLKNFTANILKSLLQVGDDT